MATIHRITPGTLSILESCTVSGNNISLPAWQLDRADYSAVNKVLELMGGKWSKTAKAHVFPEAPGDLLDTVILTEEITNKKQLFQFFETPEVPAKRMAVLACIERTSYVLEPSAGRGRIARELLKFSPRSLTLIEMSPDNYPFLAGLGANAAFLDDFMTLSVGGMKFDAIVMNPPFTRGQDIKHIDRALQILAPGGRLVAICSAGPKQELAFRTLSDVWEELPSDTFAESGTNVSTVLLRITR